MKLLAISDLHVGISANRRFVEDLPASPADWLILGGDIGEEEDELRFVLDTLAPRFAQLVWVPGNHELWTVRNGGLRGEARYRRLVDLCKSRGTLTPEDEYPRWPGEGPPVVIAPLFLLYDYSFRPDDVSFGEAMRRANEAGTVCADEEFLHPDPYASREAWCAHRCQVTEARLEAIPEGVGTILINHYPLRREHARLPAIPNFSIWCGTRRTEDWHVRFRARAVVFGHLHIRQCHYLGGIAFHEVSLGYPRQWRTGEPARYLREIWPPAPMPP